jgi:phosphoglycolate phosphatase-like HAD superfamily hydrolase
MNENYEVITHVVGIMTGYISTNAQARTLVTYLEKETLARGTIFDVCTPEGLEYTRVHLSKLVLPGDVSVLTALKNLAVAVGVRSGLTTKEWVILADHLYVTYEFIHEGRMQIQPNPSGLSEGTKSLLLYPEMIMCLLLENISLV